MEHKNTAQWTEVIEPRGSLFSLRLGELWRYRDLILLFVRRDFIATYKQTILGPLWFFIQPLLTTLTYLVIFSRIAGISTGGYPPVLFYLSGIVLWNYFSDCVIKTSNVFVQNASIFGKVYFPRLTTPISIILSNLLKLAIQAGLFVVVYAYYLLKGDVSFCVRPSLLLFPLLLLLLAMLGLGVGIIVSSLTTKYRDLSYLIQFGVQLLMYATPVIYPLSSVGGKLKSVLSLNPLTPVIETSRSLLFCGQDIFIQEIAVSFVLASVVLFIGILIFNRVERSFMDTV